MRHHLYLRASFKHFAIFAIATSCILWAPGAKAQTPTWTVQIDVTGSGSKPAYKLIDTIPTPAKERCDFKDPNVISTAENLQVCPDDKIDWVVKTKAAHVEVFLYYNDAILLDHEGDPNHGFHASNKDPVEGIVVDDDDATPDVYYKYYVVVLDKDNVVTYYDDPKIMIGTGNSPVAITNAIAKQAKQLQLQAKRLEVKAEKLKKVIDSQRTQK